MVVGGGGDGDLQIPNAIPTNNPSIPRLGVTKPYPTLNFKTIVYKLGVITNTTITWLFKKRGRGLYSRGNQTPSHTQNQNNDIKRNLYIIKIKKG